MSAHGLLVLSGEEYIYIHIYIYVMGSYMSYISLSPALNPKTYNLIYAYIHVYLHIYIHFSLFPTKTQLDGCSEE